MDSDDDEERRLLLSESPSLTASPVISREQVREQASVSRRQQEPRETQRKHQLLPRLAWTAGPSMEADKECDKPVSFLLLNKNRIRDLYKNRRSFNRPALTYLRVSMQES